MKRKVQQRETIILLLREFARRTVQDHRANLQAAHGQLRTINNLARDILATSRYRQRRKATLQIAP
jgi:hypothetical protein